jgi:hypothetical protein
MLHLLAINLRHFEMYETSYRDTQRETETDVLKCLLCCDIQEREYLNRTDTYSPCERKDSYPSFKLLSTKRSNTSGCQSSGLSVAMSMRKWLGLVTGRNILRFYIVHLLYWRTGAGSNIGFTSKLRIAFDDIL